MPCHTTELSILGRVVDGEIDLIFDTKERLQKKKRVMCL